MGVLWQCSASRGWSLCQPVAPQCRNAATPAGLTAEPAGPAGNKGGRATSPTVTWHSWQLSQCPCEGFYQHLVRGGNGNPQRGGCQNPWVQFSSIAEPAGPAGKIMPLIALARTETLISVSQLPLSSQGYWHSHWETAAGRDLP